MTPSDPFSTDRDDDRTILRPSPGGRRRRTSATPQAPPPYAPGRPDRDVRADFLTGDNPIVSEAFTLLSVVPKLHNLPFHHAVDDLRHQLAGEVQRFQTRAANQGIPQEQVRIASYFLCTLIDETVLNTPWGDQSGWGHKSLLITFHGEARGGERFFELLDRLKGQPARHLTLLELAHVCLSLGFEGKYRHMSSGLRALDQLREDLYLSIRRTKGDAEPSLAVNWRGLAERHRPIGRQVPLWVATAVAGALLMLIFMGFAYAVNSASNRTYQRLARAVREAARTPPTSAQPPAAPSAPSVPAPLSGRFERLLAAEITRGMVEVVDGPILRISNAFPSGSDQIKPAYAPMLAKIAGELQRDGRRIVVVGHTDDRPIFSARFPSNWHLSQARASNVAAILKAAAPLDGRLRVEGRSDGEPIVPNDTPANRARNRRIDIHIR